MKAAALKLESKVRAAADLPMMTQARILPELLAEYARLLAEVAGQVEAMKTKVDNIADIIAQSV